MRVFSRRNVTNGFSDTCREEDRRQDERRSRDLPVGVERVRAAVASMSGQAEAIPTDWYEAGMPPREERVPSCK